MHIFAATVTLQANAKIAPSYGNGHFVRSSRRDRAAFDAGPACCLKHSRIGQLFELNFLAAIMSSVSCLMRHLTCMKDSIERKYLSSFSQNI